jgi:hypothetical protein
MGFFAKGGLFSRDVSSKYNLEWVKILPHKQVIWLADTYKTYKIRIGTIGWCYSDSDMIQQKGGCRFGTVKAIKFGNELY